MHCWYCGSAEKIRWWRDWSVDDFNAMEIRRASRRNPRAPESNGATYQHITELCLHLTACSGPCKQRWAPTLWSPQSCERVIPTKGWLCTIFIVHNLTTNKTVSDEPQRIYQWPVWPASVLHQPGQIVAQFHTHDSHTNYMLALRSTQHPYTQHNGLVYKLTLHLCSSSQYIISISLAQSWLFVTLRASKHELHRFIIIGSARLKTVESNIPMQNIMTPSLDQVKIIQFIIFFLLITYISARNTQ